MGAGLAALASFLISPIYLAKFSNGETLGLVAFIAAIVAVVTWAQFQFGERHVHYD